MSYYRTCAVAHIGPCPGDPSGGPWRVPVVVGRLKFETAEVEPPDRRTPARRQFGPCPKCGHPLTDVKYHGIGGCSGCDGRFFGEAHLGVACLRCGYSWAEAPNS